MAERISNLGYFSFAKETVKNTPVTPLYNLPIYDETLSTNANFIPQTPIYGNKFETFLNLQGQRDHGGELTILAEANTLARLHDFFLTVGATTGSNPYTTPSTLSNTTDPKTATFDISNGNVVRRYWGVGISSIAPDWNDNEMRIKLKVSAIGSFQARTIKTVATTNLTLDQAYDPQPNKGLVVGDLVRIYKPSTGATLDTTIATVNANGTDVVLGASAAAFAAGDIIQLRPAAVSFNLTNTFLWAKTYIGIGATASAALANATVSAQTRLEQGTTFELMHKFKDDAGEKRSGGFDPATLIRTLGNYTVTIKRFFDGPEDIQLFNDMTKRSVVFKMVTGANNEYNWTVTMNNLTWDTPAGNLTSGDVTYSEITGLPQYDQADGQGFSSSVTHAIATI